MRSDSPGPSWYEPPDLDDDDEPEPAEPEPFVVSHGVVIWRQIP